MNKIFKLSLTLFAIVAGTLLLMAGAGTGPRYVGRFYGNGLGLSNAVDLVAGPNINITIGPGNRSFTVESTAAGSAGIFTNAIMGYGDEYRTNYVRISPSGVSLTGGGSFAGDGSGLTNIPKGAIVGLTNLSNLTITNGVRMTNVTTLGLTNYSNLGTYTLNLWDVTQTTWTPLFVDDFTFNFGGISVSNALFYGDGGGLTSLNGSQITAGTVADARIASTIARDTEVTTATQNSTNAGNIAFLPADNVFNGSNYFSDVLTANTLGVENFYPTNINAWYITNTNGVGGLPIPTNAPAAGKEFTATSASTSAWLPKVYPFIGYGAQGAAAFPRWDTLDGGLNSGVETNGYSPWPVTGYPTNFYLQMTAVAGAGTNHTWTFYTNGVASPFTVTLIGGQSRTNSGSLSFASLPIGTPVAIEVNCPTNHGATLHVKWSFQIVTP